MNTRQSPQLPQNFGHRLLPQTARAAAATLGLVLLPKCPLCIAAYLVSFGLGTTAAAFAAPLVRPLGWLLAGTACAALVYGAWRHVRAQRAATHRRATVECGCD